MDGNPSVGAGHADGVSAAPNLPGTIAPLGPSADANTMTIGVKYVALKNATSDAPSPTKEEVVTLLQNMSNIWSQCNIRFELDDYSAPVASAENVLYYPSNQSDLEDMRTRFFDGNHALFVKSGAWNRSGDLGNDGSNGFSTVPPANPEGTVVEESVAKIPLLNAHETGHLIGGLGHTTDSTMLMNHFVSPSTTNLTESECNDTRSAMQQYHSSWIRK